MAEASLKLGTDWATKESSLLGYNDENGNYKPIPFDFSRASIGTRVNRDGLIEEVQDNIPRIDFSNGDASLLLEPQRTNLITYSSDFSQWSLANAGNGLTPILTSGYDTHLGLSASRIIFERTSASTSNTSTIRGNDYTAGTNTFSIYIKSNTSNVTIDFRLGATITTQLITTDWQRVTFTGSDFYRSLFGFIGNDSDLYADLSIVAAQAEAGSYSTTIIPTSGSAVTRVADACNNAQTTFNNSEGVLYAEIAALANDGTERYIYLGDGTTGNRVVIRFSPTENDIRMLVSSGGSTQVSSGTTSYTTTNFNKIALKYKLNDFALWVNGVEVLTDTSGSTPIGISELDLSYGATQLYGNCKELRVYNTALTDTELQELTTL